MLTNISSIAILQLYYLDIAVEVMGKTLEIVSFNVTCCLVSVDIHDMSDEQYAHAVQLQDRGSLSSSGERLASSVGTCFEHQRLGEPR